MAAWGECYQKYDGPGVIEELMAADVASEQLDLAPEVMNHFRLPDIR